MKLEVLFLIFALSCVSTYPIYQSSRPDSYQQAQIEPQPNYQESKPQQTYQQPQYQQPHAQPQYQQQPVYEQRTLSQYPSLSYYDQKDVTRRTNSFLDANLRNMERYCNFDETQHATLRPDVRINPLITNSFAVMPGYTLFVVPGMQPVVLPGMRPFF